MEELREVRRGLLDIVGVFLKAAATQSNALSSDDVQVDNFLTATLFKCIQPDADRSWCRQSKCRLP